MSIVPSVFSAVVASIAAILAGTTLYYALLGMSVLLRP
jgi:hypothetical protein